MKASKKKREEEIKRGLLQKIFFTNGVYCCVEDSKSSVDDLSELEANYQKYFDDFFKQDNIDKVLKEPKNNVQLLYLLLHNMYVEGKNSYLFDQLLKATNYYMSNGLDYYPAPTVELSCTVDRYQYGNQNTIELIEDYLCEFIKKLPKAPNIDNVPLMKLNDDIKKDVKELEADYIRSFIIKINSLEKHLKHKNRDKTKTYYNVKAQS